MALEINKIYNLDCLIGMKKIPDKSIDMTFTSPPFKDEDVPGDYWEFYDAFFNEAQRVTSKVICIIHSSTKMNTIITKYPPKRTIIWGKGISQYSFRYNPVFCYQICEEYKINKHIWCDVFGVQSVTGKWKVHRYQDPVVLYRTLIKMFKGCNTVLDPFMGSGTTAIVCKTLGLNYIGFEKSEEIFNVSTLQLEQGNISEWF